MVSRRSFTTGLMAAATLAAGITRPASASGKVTSFAAASLKTALDEASVAWKAGTGKETTNAYAASSALAKQIEAGAPADIFISADLDWMDYVEQRKLVKAGTRANLLHNRLVLIAPADSKLQIELKPGFPLAKLLGDGRLSMADPDSVPAGKYGKAALENLGVWSSVESRVARGDNVRAALVFVARGEAALGIVYQTDALADKKVRMVARFPQETHAAITYPVAVMAASRHPAAAAFVNYLKSAEARAIFEKYGFSMDR